jgi:nucleoid-associated protein YgaU
MSLKVESSPGNFQEPFEVMFNPTQFSIDRTMNWPARPGAHDEKPTPKFTHNDPATLTISFFFDTFETKENVKTHSDKVRALGSCIAGMHRPPVVQFLWGNADKIFAGVCTKMSEAFTFFLADGTPVRATLACTFKELVNADEQHSADVTKVHTLRRGDTLSAIAALEYNDPGVWRLIASANRIVDALRLTPGTTLVLPAVKGPLPR